MHVWVLHHLRLETETFPAWLFMHDNAFKLFARHKPYSTQVQSARGRQQVDRNDNSVCFGVNCLARKQTDSASDALIAWVKAACLLQRGLEPKEPWAVEESFFKMGLALCFFLSRLLASLTVRPAQCAFVTDCAMC